MDSRTQELSGLSRIWRGVIWASQQEAKLSRDKLSQLTGWISTVPGPPYSFRAPVVSAPLESEWDDSTELALNFEAISDELIFVQVIYSYFAGIALCVERGGHYFALRSWKQIGEERVVEAIAISRDLAQTMLKLPGSVIENPKDER